MTIKFYQIAQADEGVKTRLDKAGYSPFNKNIKIVFFGLPATPIYEIADYISSLYKIDLFTLSSVLTDSGSEYFIDKVSEVDFDTGDYSPGSASQKSYRDPSSMDNADSINNFSLSVPQEQEHGIEDYELLYKTILAESKGVCVTEVPETRLIDWASDKEQNSCNMIVFLDADPSFLVNWLKERRQCFSCGEIYHNKLLPPKDLGYCDRCGTDLDIRPEDEPENIRHQINIWKKMFVDFTKKAKEAKNLITIKMDNYDKMDKIVKDLNRFLHKEISK